MSRLRAPTVGGLAGGVGATTVARALHAREIGPVAAAGRLPDVVVCRATVSGLALAELAPAADDPGPVLAVTAAPGDPDPAVTERMAEVSGGWSGPVVLPHVEHWALLEDPYAEAAGLLGRAEPSDTLSHYAEALARIVALLTTDGRLERPEDGTGCGVLRPVRGVRVRMPVEPAPTWNGLAAAGSAW